MADGNERTHFRRDSDENQPLKASSKRNLSPLTTDPSVEQRRGSAIDSAVGASPATPVYAHAITQQVPALPTVPEANVQTRDYPVHTTTSNNFTRRPLRAQDSTQQGTAPDHAASVSSRTAIPSCSSVVSDEKRLQSSTVPVLPEYNDWFPQKNVPHSGQGRRSGDLPISSDEPQQESATSYQDACKDAGLVPGQTTQSIQDGPCKDPKIADPDSGGDSSFDADNLVQTPQFVDGNEQSGLRRPCGGEEQFTPVHRERPVADRDLPSLRFHSSTKPQENPYNSIYEKEKLPLEARSQPKAKLSLLAKLWYMRRGLPTGLQTERLDPPGPEGFNRKQQKQMKIAAKKGRKLAEKQHKEVEQDRMAASDQELTTTIGQQIKRFITAGIDFKGKGKIKDQPSQLSAIDSSQSQPCEQNSEQTFIDDVQSSSRLYKFRGNTSQHDGLSNSIRERASQFWDRVSFKHGSEEDSPFQLKGKPFKHRSTSKEHSSDHFPTGQGSPATNRWRRTSSSWKTVSSRNADPTSSTSVNCNKESGVKDAIETLGIERCRLGRSKRARSFTEPLRNASTERIPSQCHDSGDEVWPLRSYLPKPHGTDLCDVKRVGSIRQSQTSTSHEDGHLKSAGTISVRSIWYHQTVNSLRAVVENNQKAPQVAQHQRRVKSEADLLATVADLSQSSWIPPRTTIGSATATIRRVTSGETGVVPQLPQYFLHSSSVSRGPVQTEQEEPPRDGSRTDIQGISQS